MGDSIAKLLILPDGSESESKSDSLSSTSTKSKYEAPKSARPMIMPSAKTNSNSNNNKNDKTISGDYTSLDGVKVQEKSGQIGKEKLVIKMIVRYVVNQVVK